jgi:hypothetical protein
MVFGPHGHRPPEDEVNPVGQFRSMVSDARYRAGLFSAQQQKNDLGQSVYV